MTRNYHSLITIKIIRLLASSKSKTLIDITSPINSKWWWALTTLTLPLLTADSIICRLIERQMITTAAHWLIALWNKVRFNRWHLDVISISSLVRFRINSCRSEATVVRLDNHLTVWFQLSWTEVASSKVEASWVFSTTVSQSPICSEDSPPRSWWTKSGKRKRLYRTRD